MKKNILKTPGILVDYILKLDVNNKHNNEVYIQGFSSILEQLSDKLQAYSLKTGFDKFVIGISGGIDSAYTALVCYRALQKMNKSSKNLILVSLPGPGSGKTTTGNVKRIAEYTDATLITENITPLVDEVLKTTKTKEDRTTVYENIQARLRTLVLMTLANKHKALEIGTGDFSEIVLGWCTHGGDNISMLDVNSSLSKTFLREALRHYSEYKLEKNKNSDVFTDIAKQVISPELLPSENGEEFSQNTEDLIGSYDFIDTLIYHYIVNNKNESYCIEKVKETLTFSDEYVQKYANIFFKRFKEQYFKRVGCTSLSVSNLPLFLRLKSSFN